MQILIGKSFWFPEWCKNVARAVYARNRESKERRKVLCEWPVD